MEWSKEQELAIFNRDKTNILTSAGAGSGKTAVLTERIYQLIKEGVSLDEEVAHQAELKGVNVLSTDKSAYETAIILSELL